MARDIIEGLKALQGFNILADPVLATLASYAKVRSVRACETVFCQGEPSPYFFGVLSGEVTIQRSSKDKRFQNKIIGIVGPGGLFGESAIFEDSPRVAMASASKDSELLVVKGVHFRDWMCKNPQEAQPLLLALLKTSLSRLHRTNLELSVVYGIGRVLGSSKAFPEQLISVLDFMKSSLEGLDDIVVYQRNAFWEEFEPLQSLPHLKNLPAVPLSNELIQKASTLGAIWAFEPKSFPMPLEAFRLDWGSRASVAIVPLLNWEKAAASLQGLLLMASKHNAGYFHAEKQLLYTSVARQFSEALSRYERFQELEAQSRLQHSKQSFQP